MLTRPLRHRTFRRVCGSLLLGLGAVTAVFWFCYFKPATKRFDPLRPLQFTAKAYWKDLQKGIRRFGWAHDDFVTVGRYGDKAWAQWIMKKVQDGEPISDCGLIGHKDAAMQYITCQDPAGNDDHGDRFWTEKQWLAWWRTNEAKSQVEWVQDGLGKYGVRVHLPPCTNGH